MKRKGLKFDLLVSQYIQFESEVVSLSPVTLGDKNSRWDVTLLCHKTGTRSHTVADLVIITGVRESQPRVPDIGSQSVVAAGKICPDDLNFISLQPGTIALKDMLPLKEA